MYIEIYNYLRKPVQLLYNEKTYSIPVGFSKLNLDLSKHTVIRFIWYKHILGDYYVGDNFPKELHVGQIVAKYQYMSYAYVPIKDIVDLRIHNLTGIPLCFNKHIQSPPRQMITYTGREQNGVYTGFTLDNCNNLYPPFVLKRPVTDIYYGVISDHKMPAFTSRYLRI